MMEVPLPYPLGLLVEEELRMWGKRFTYVGGVVGAWAICAIPFPFISMLSSVVCLVLAAMLLKVRGSDRYDEEDREGDGEGGALGGIGRTDASSSASRTLPGDQVDSGSRED